MKYLVDSFQLFLNCDQEMENWLYDNGLKKTVPVYGRERATMPIIYCDNTISTISKEKHLRKYAFPAEYYGEKGKDIGWKNTYRGVEIPSENFFVDIIDLGDTIKLSADLQSDYHLEFKYKLNTAMHQWENWLGIYIPIPVAIQMMNDLRVQVDPKKLISTLTHEKKQTSGKREDFYYSSLSIEEFQFTYESFEQAKKFLEKQSFNGDYKALTYNRKTDSVHPFMKVGYVHTKETDGDFERNPQISIKLSQRKTVSGTKPRGKLESIKETQNYIIVNKQQFVFSVMSALFTCYKGVCQSEEGRKIQKSVV